jgi:hypothetical protein
LLALIATPRSTVPYASWARWLGLWGPKLAVIGLQAVNQEP